MQVDWLLATLGVLVAVGFFGFIGGVAGALVGGGSEDRSLLTNAGIGLLGALVGGSLWAAVTGRTLELGGSVEMGPADIVAALVGSVVVLVVWTLVQRRRSSPAAN